jgi:aspartate/tyrosine/aromatic aminotransferase
MALQLLVFTAGALLTVTTAAQLHQPSIANLPNPTSSGYLDIHKNAGSKIYYQYYEADSECNGFWPTSRQQYSSTWLHSQ